MCAIRKLKFMMYADDTTIYFNLYDCIASNIVIGVNYGVNTWLKLNK